MKALVYEGRVCDVAEEEFPVHPSMAWIDGAPDDVAIGWRYEDGQFINPNQPQGDD